MALSKTTQDHDEIRQWAESRGGIPAEVASTEHEGQTGILRIEFPGAKNANDSALKEISWDEFFEKFDENRLALIYQERTADGEQSSFNKLVYPENSKVEAAGKGAGRKSTGSGGASRKATSKSGGGTKSQNAAPAKAAKSVPAKKLASTQSSAKKSQAKKTPVKKAPAKKALAKKVTAKKAPATKAPAKKSSSKKAIGARSR